MLGTEWADSWCLWNKSTKCAFDTGFKKNCKWREICIFAYFVKIFGFIAVQESNMLEFILSVICIHIQYDNKMIFINIGHSWQFSPLFNVKTTALQKVCSIYWFWWPFFTQISTLWHKLCQVLLVHPWRPLWSLPPWAICARKRLGRGVNNK